MVANHIPTLYLTSALTKDAIILDFSEIVNSQAAVTTDKTSISLQMQLLILSTICLLDVHILA